MKPLVSFCLCFHLFCWTGLAQSQSRSEDFDRRISTALQVMGAPSVSVATVEGDRITYARAFGFANLQEQRAATPETRYAVGSISKQFTAAAILLAQEEGKLSLDDKVSRYFPELTRASEITIRQLLSHTSGYEDYAPQDYIIPEWTRPTTAQQILDRWARKPLNFDPGTEWQYSNTNYVLAGKIFEKATDRPLLTFLRAKIFDPLGMTTAGDCDERRNSDASRYTRFALGPPRPVAGEGQGWYFAAGELCMTASDLARWDIAFLQKRILSSKSYDEFTHEVALKNGKPAHYALGLSIGELNGTPAITHGGEVSGFLAMNSVLPAKKVAVVILSNEDGINLIGPLSRDIATSLIEPARSDSDVLDHQVRTVLEGLMQGRIDRSLFTQNANAYFSDVALNDYRVSLSSIGKLLLLSRQSQQGRGGMTHLSYRAQFQNKTVSLNIYVTPDKKFEQFMVEE